MGESPFLFAKSRMDQILRIASWPGACIMQLQRRKNRLYLWLAQPTSSFSSYS